MVNTSVQEGGAPKQHTQHGGGRSPTQAEAFVAMKSSEERCQAVTHHAKHDNRAVASTTRCPEGGREKEARRKHQADPTQSNRTQSRTEQSRENNSKTRQSVRGPSGRYLKGGA